MTERGRLNLQADGARQNAEHVPKSLLYITGSGHSGSTLLNLMLNCHSKISALGEAHRLWLSAQIDEGVHRCTCGQSVKECEFWQKVSEGLRSIHRSEDPDILSSLPTTDTSFLTNLGSSDSTYLGRLRGDRRVAASMNRLLMILGSARVWSVAARGFDAIRNHYKAVENSLSVFEAVRLVAGTPVIVDATKNPARMKGFYLADSKTPFRIVHLLRDGRAVCFSRMRRENTTMERAAAVWVKEQRKQRLARLTMPANIVLEVRYENLAADPSRELARICEFLGLTFEKGMEDFRNHRHHVIGGNPMRYRAGERAIISDERWRKELTDSDLATFEKVAGKSNRRLGYGDA